MANGHGGQRTPEHPAAVSGPGALSQRTDGNPATTQPPMVASGGPYGSRQEMEAIQSAAPMQGGGEDLPSPRDLPGITDPSARPDEPVTAGAALGPGIGPRAAGIEDDTTASLRQIAHLVPSLEMIANLPGSTQATRSFVRNLKAQIASL